MWGSDWGWGWPGGAKGEGMVGCHSVSNSDFQKQKQK